MKRFFILVLALGAICPALAGNATDPTLVVPKTSGLTVTHVSPKYDDEASFKGQVWVSGLFLAQWPADIKALDPRDEIEVTIKLDKKDISRLPYYNWPEWHRTYIPDTIDIVNRDEAVRLVFPKQLSTRLLNKQVQMAKVHARFLLTTYKTGIECDAPWAHAELISAEVTEVAQTSTETDLSGC